MMRYLLAFLLVLVSAQAAHAASNDSSPHKAMFVTVQGGVKLEVLDWGGKGPPLVLLAGLSSSAHSFDDLATKFTGSHRVYGITRRGIGRSSKPPAYPENYDADKLGDDVLSVLKQLKIQKPILVGHSFGGVELSSIGSRHPEMVTGLVYIDAGYPRAFYDPKVPLAYEVDAAVISRNLRRFQWASPKEARTLIAEIRRTLPNLERGLDWYEKTLKGSPEFQASPDQWAIAHATLGGDRKHDNIKAPMLLLFAIPKSCRPNCKNNDELWQDAEELQRKSIRSRYPNARIVLLNGADHAIWKTNEQDLLREMNVFFTSLSH